MLYLDQATGQFLKWLASVKKKRLMVCPWIKTDFQQHTIDYKYNQKHESTLKH